MKRKIGELRNVPIVEGDKNLVREGTEIHINDLQSKGSSSGDGGIMEVEYLYIKGPALTYYKAIGVVEAVGKYSIGTASIPNTFTAFSAGGTYIATIKGFKLVKGLFKENNTIYDTTTYNKFIETYELDPSSYEEITKEYYENMENWK